MNDVRTTHSSCTTPSFNVKQPTSLLISHWIYQNSCYVGSILGCVLICNTIVYLSVVACGPMAIKATQDSLLGLCAIRSILAPVTSSGYLPTNRIREPKKGFDAGKPPQDAMQCCSTGSSTQVASQTNDKSMWHLATFLRWIVVLSLPASTPLLLLLVLVPAWRANLTSDCVGLVHLPHWKTQHIYDPLASPAHQLLALSASRSSKELLKHEKQRCLWQSMALQPNASAISGRPSRL